MASNELHLEGKAAAMLQDYQAVNAEGGKVSGQRPAVEIRGGTWKRERDPNSPFLGRYRVERVINYGGDPKDKRIARADYEVSKDGLVFLHDSVVALRRRDRKEKANTDHNSSHEAVLKVAATVRMEDGPQKRGRQIPVLEYTPIIMDPMFARESDAELGIKPVVQDGKATEEVAEKPATDGHTVSWTGGELVEYPAEQQAAEGVKGHTDIPIKKTPYVARLQVPTEQGGQRPAFLFSTGDTSDGFTPRTTPDGVIVRMEIEPSDIVAVNRSNGSRPAETIVDFRPGFLDRATVLPPNPKAKK